MTDQEPRRGLDRLFHLDWLPSRIFGGRMRTSTFILIVAWILTYLLHTYLNPEDPTAVTPPPSVDTSQTEPYVAPSVKPSTTTPRAVLDRADDYVRDPVSGIEHGQLRFSDADFGSRACAGQRRTVRDHGADHSGDDDRSPTRRGDAGTDVCAAVTRDHRYRIRTRVLARGAKVTVR